MCLIFVWYGTHEKFLTFQITVRNWPKWILNTCITVLYYDIFRIWQLVYVSMHQDYAYIQYAHGREKVLQSGGATSSLPLYV